MRSSVSRPETISSSRNRAPALDLSHLTFCRSERGWWLLIMAEEVGVGASSNTLVAVSLTGFALLAGGLAWLVMYSNQLKEEAEDEHEDDGTWAHVDPAQLNRTQRRARARAVAKGVTNRKDRRKAEKLERQALQDERKKHIPVATKKERMEVQPKEEIFVQNMTMESFLRELKEDGIILVAALAERLESSIQELEGALRKLVDDKRVAGVLTSDGRFVYYAEEDLADIAAKLEAHDHLTPELVIATAT